MTKINQLESLKVLKAVVESGSFTAAAQRLNISAARVSKSVERLEIELGTTLFNRNTRHMQITESGERCYSKALKLINQWHDLKEELIESHVAPKGKLRISVPMTWGLCRFTPLLAGFMEQYPDIKLDVQMSDQHVNVLEEEYDLVLRLTSQLPDSALLCRKITSYKFIVCASRTYLEKHEEPSHPNDLKNHDCLMYTRPGAAKRWQFREGRKNIDVYLEPQLQSNNSKLLHAALIEGQGIALIPDFIVSDDIACDRLSPILQNFQTTELNLYSLRPNIQMTSYRLRVFHDYLYNHLR